MGGISALIGQNIAAAVGLLGAQLGANLSETNLAIDLVPVTLQSTQFGELASTEGKYVADLEMAAGRSNSGELDGLAGDLKSQKSVMG